MISNCVINLVPDKQAVFREILRVLKPGGRVALSDIALKQELPAAVKQSVEAYVGCISGAIRIHEYRSMLENAGFSSVVVTDTGADLNAYALASEGGCCSSSPCPAEMEPTSASNQQGSLHDGLASVMRSFDANAFAASVRVHALKPLSLSIDPAVVGSGNQAVMAGQKKRVVEVFDKPMCCSTGVCGPDVDPVLPQFAADLGWLKSQGHQVERYNLAQNPLAFIENKLIHHLLSTEGTGSLPVIVIDGEIFSRATYPSRETLSAWVGGTPAKRVLPVFKATGGSCGTEGCC